MDIRDVYKECWEEYWKGMKFQDIPEHQQHIYNAMQKYAESRIEEFRLIVENETYKATGDDDLRRRIRLISLPSQNNLK